MYGIPRGKQAQQQKRGGPVKGRGTGTSDSIKAEVPEGSYIMPADSTAALGLGKASVPVNLSNGEYQLAPEQVHAVGVQALDQAKDATHAAVAQPQSQGGELFFANGGAVEDPLKKKQTSFDATNTQVKPGYSSFTPVRDLQRADDARQQQTAVRADAAQQTVGRSTGGAVDAAMQAGAVQNSLPPQVPAAPASAVARGTDSFAPGLNVMQPARDAQITRGIRQGEQAAQAQQTVTASGQGAIRDAQAGKFPPSPQGSQPAQPGMTEEFAGGLSGAGKTMVGALAYPQLAAYDGVRNLAGELAGGDTSQIKQYRHDAGAMVNEGVTQMQDSSAALRGRAAAGTRGALGIGQAAPDIPQAPTAAGNPPTGKQAPAVAPQVATTQPQAQQVPSPAQAPVTGNDFVATGIGQGAAGGQIVGRTGANGVPEFTNDQAAVAGAGAAPALGISRVGDGKGTFTQQAPGTAAAAMATFDKANEIRAGMNAGRARELGDNGNKLTIVRDSSRAPTFAEMQNDKLEGRQTQRGLEGRKVDQADTANSLREREVSNAEQTSQLLRDKTRQDIAAGSLTVEQQQRVAQIQQQLADPNLTQDQRAQLESAYYSLTGNSKDRYMEVRGGKNGDGVVAPSTVFDTRTGKTVGAASGATVTSAMVDAKAKESGKTREQVIEAMTAKGITING